MTYQVFIDGQSGTTGLHLQERLANRKDITLLHICLLYTSPEMPDERQTWIISFPSSRKGVK